jgi:integrase
MVLALLYGAALRTSEALHLSMRDVDLADAVLTVRNTKFFKSRLVPVAPQLATALRVYAKRRSDRPLPEGTESAFLANVDGTRVRKHNVDYAFKRLLLITGISRKDDGRRAPCLHALRHTAAVHRLTSWYREGADIQRLLPALSTYLGHAHLEDTSIYLSMTPDLLYEASAYFDRYVNGGDYA